VPVMVGADADAQFLDRALREEALDLDASGGWPPAVWRVGLCSPARHLRLVHLLPRYHTGVCHHIHACFAAEVKADVSGSLGR